MSVFEKVGSSLRCQLSGLYCRPKSVFSNLVECQPGPTENPEAWPMVQQSWGRLVNIIYFITPILGVNISSNKLLLYDPGKEGKSTCTYAPHQTQLPGTNPDKFEY